MVTQKKTPTKPKKDSREEIVSKIRSLVRSLDHTTWMSNKERAYLVKINQCCHNLLGIWKEGE